MTDVVGQEPVTPTGTTERLRQLWGEVLQRTDIGPESDFFDLGGDSFAAVELMSMVREAFGVALRAGDLFVHPTLAELADHVSRRAA